MTHNAVATFYSYGLSPQKNILPDLEKLSVDCYERHKTSVQLFVVLKDSK